MGHIRLGRLPRTRKWQAVVALLGGDAPLADIAAASAAAAQSGLRFAHADPALAHSFWLLTTDSVSCPIQRLFRQLGRAGSAHRAQADAHVHCGWLLGGYR